MLECHFSSLIRPLLLALLAGAIAPLHGALTMKIDLDNDLFYVEGSDSGNGFADAYGYSVQFYYGFATQPSASATISNAPQNLFNESGTISSSGMNLIRGDNSPNYVFIDLYSSSSDITTLSGKGPSGSISYAHLPTADQTLFESMIGQSMSLAIGTGYSAMAVQAVPEPATLALVTGTLAGLFCWLRRRRRS